MQIQVFCKRDLSFKNYYEVPEREIQPVENSCKADIWREQSYCKAEILFSDDHQLCKKIGQIEHHFF